MKIRLGTVFSGIGAIEQALKRLHIEHEIVFACDNGDIDLPLFDEKITKEYKDLKTKRGKRTLSEQDEMRLNDLSLQENILAEQTRQYIYNLPTKQDKIDYVNNLYAIRCKRKKNYVKESYLANYPNVKDYHLDIRFLDGKDYKNEIDLLVGGSPCQAFSTVGAQCGLDDTRGTLFYEFARILSETQPKAFIYENVKGLTTHDNGKTWETIKHIFTDVLGYNITEPQILNASDYGIPQTRRRVFVIGTRKDIECERFEYPRSIGCEFTMQDFLEDNCKDGNFLYDENGNIKIIKSQGDKKHIDKFILSEKMSIYILASGTKNFKTSTQTDLPIARTLLKTMTQHHRAGVDNYITVGTYPSGQKTLRALTDRECLRLMGYDDNFKIAVSPMQIYRQAGNSIVVDVMMHIVKQLIKTKIFEQ